MKKSNIVRNDKCLMYHACYCYVLYSSINPSPIRSVPRYPRPLRNSQPEYSPVGTRRPWLPSSWGITCWWLTSHIEYQETATRTKSADSLTVTRHHSTYRRVNYGTRWFSLMRTDYAACLRTVNDVLSQIPPFALYVSHRYYPIVPRIRVSLSTYISTIGHRRRGETHNCLASGSVFP